MSRRTLFETALIRCARAATVVTIEEILTKINALKGSGDLHDVPKAEARQPAASLFEAKRPAPPPRETRRPSRPAAPADQELAKLKAEWGSLVERVSRHAVGVKGALRDAQPVAIDNLCLTIGYAPEFAEEMENFKSPRVRAALQHVLKSMLHREVSVEFEAVEDLAPTVKAKPVPEPVYAVPESKPQKVAESAESEKMRHSRADWQQNPEVQRVLDTFNGTIMDVRE